MLAAARDIALGEQGIDRALHRGDRRTQPLELHLRVLGDHLFDQHARLVDDGGTERKAGIEAHTVEAHGQEADPVSGHALVRTDEIAAGGELRQHHRYGLQRLDLVLGVVPLGPVLHGENAQHAVAAHDRHAHHRVIDLLAGLGPVGEIGMRLGVGERERPRRRPGASCGAPLPGAGPRSRTARAPRPPAGCSRSTPPPPCRRQSSARWC